MGETLENRTGETEAGGNLKFSDPSNAQLHRELFTWQAPSSVFVSQASDKMSNYTYSSLLVQQKKKRVLAKKKKKKNGGK